MTTTVKSINLVYYTGSPVLSLKEKVIRGRFSLVSCECYEVSSNSLLSIRIKAFEALLPVSILGGVISPLPWKCCGKIEHTGRASGPQHSTANVQLAMLDAEPVQLSDLWVIFLSFPTTAPFPFSHHLGRSSYQLSREAEMATNEFSNLINICKSYK